MACAVGCVLPPPCGLASDSAAIPVELAAIAIDVSIFAAEFAPFVTGGGVIAASEIVAQFAAVMCNPSLVVTDVAVQAPVPIPRQRGRHAHPD